MRILIVEDERELARALTVILKHNHYSVDAVYDGQEALDYLEVGNYDGVILDIMLPKVDGLTVLRTIREKGNHIPVLLLTAKSEIDDKVTGLDSGADDYLSKPFVMKELLARLRAVTRRQADTSEPVLSFGNIKLNRSTYDLFTDTGSLRLGSKEFQMMEMLLLAPQKLTPTEQFMEKIWGYDSEAEINVVWVYLSNLRKKLKELSADIIIKAARNAGYFLELMEENKEKDNEV